MTIAADKTAFEKTPTEERIRVLREMLDERRSVRAYKTDQVPEQTIRDIVGLAQRTATWCNTQPWHLHITSGAGTERLRNALYGRAEAGQSDETDIAYPREYRGVYQDRRRESGFALYGALGIERGDADARTKQMWENHRFFGAPHVAIIDCEEALGTYGVMDCGGFIANFLLAAQAHGVATIAQAALARHSVFLREYFGIGDDRVIVCGISFGYADEGHAANKFRLGRADVDHAMTLVTE
ncbi:MAG: nitroreductase [Rhodobiaceae bacterium]|nr:nitroreductase [Rhodobiaceae bacterium]MCC0054728.1 nitroreductase [Rhodobiaceae bacterium]